MRDQSFFNRKVTWTVLHLFDKLVIRSFLERKGTLMQI